MARGDYHAGARAKLNYEEPPTARTSRRGSSDGTDVLNRLQDTYASKKRATDRRPTKGS